MPHSENNNKSGDSGLAFGLTVATAAAFTLGAVIPLFYNTTNGTFLSNALSFSVGVMLFVSMVEIYGKSYDGFAQVYCPEVGDAICAEAFAAALGTFLAGCIICVMLQTVNNRDVHRKINAWRTGVHEEVDVSYTDLPLGWKAGFDRESQRPFYYQPTTRSTSWVFPGEQSNATNAEATSPSSPPALANNARPAPDQPVQPASDSTGPPGPWPPAAPQPAASGHPPALFVHGQAFGSSEDVEAAVAPPACPKMEDEQASMLASGIVTAVAIAIHNFPEGFVTFMATYQDSSVGAAIAFAIAMHNVPEGICVGAPVYYSTGSTWKTIAAGIFGGIWAPVGGLVAWVSFGTDEDMDGRAYGCMFGLVCGIMTFLSLCELMPLALKYSNSKWQNDLCLVLGMLTMGLSILLFEV